MEPSGNSPDNNVNSLQDHQQQLSHPSVSDKLKHAFHIYFYMQIELEKKNGLAFE